MNTKILSAASLPVLMAIFSSQAIAHHGAVSNGALYFTDTMLEFDGEIIEVLWRYPHTRARMRVVEPNGEEKIWEIEIGPTPRVFESQGRRPEDFLGNVKLAGYRSRRNPDSIGAMHLLLPSGEELVRANRSQPRWSENVVQEVEAVLDPERVAEDRRTANGIFRIWGERLHRRATVADVDEQLTARGRELFEQYDAVTDNPELECRTGIVTSMMDTAPIRFVDEGDRIIIDLEDFNAERVIYLNTEAASAEPVPAEFGYSVGHWEGDALVVRTTDIDYPLMFRDGTPHSDQVEILERFEMSENESLLTYTATVTDPVVFSEPVTVRQQRRWAPGYEMIEDFDCALDWEE